MPRKAIDHSKTIFYKLVCKDLSIGECFMGHTTSFNARKCKHKKDCSNQDNKDNMYETIRKHGGFSNWEMIQIEKAPCQDANEARARERHLTEIIFSI